MDLQTRKLNFIAKVLALNSEELISKLESMLTKEQKILNPVLKEKLTSRALTANENIKKGKVYTRREAEVKLDERLGT